MVGIDMIARVYDDKQGVFLEVEPSPDNPNDGIRISTAGRPKNVEWFGEVDLLLVDTDFAEKLAEAILTVVASQRKKAGKIPSFPTKRGTYDPREAAGDI